MYRKSSNAFSIEAPVPLVRKGTLSKALGERKAMIGREHDLPITRR
jgi:hypothetical protein